MQGEPVPPRTGRGNPIAAPLEVEFRAGQLLTGRRETRRQMEAGCAAMFPRSSAERSNRRSAAI
jgi:hypothetical protein